jgi:hypothetical protein
MDHRRVLSAAVFCGLIAPTLHAVADERDTVVVRGGRERPAREPQVAVSPSGQVFVTYGVGNDLYCATSADGGRTFGPPREVGTGGVLSLGMRRGPRIAATSQAVMIAAIAGAQGKGADGDVVAWRSTDGGQTWSGPRRVSDIDGSAREGLHALAAGPKGELYCVWNDNRETGRMAIFGARSDDGGLSWSPSVKVYQAPEGPICPCCHPSAAFAPDGTLLVMWRNALQGARDMYLTRSTDGGQTFGPAEKQGGGTWRIDACPMDGGSIVAGPDGRTETVWMREFSVFRSRPGQPEDRIGPGIQAWAAPGPGGAYVAWLVGRPGRLLLQVPGEEAPTALAEKANDPVVGSALDGRGPVILAWEDPESGGILARVLVRRADGTRE